MAQQLVEVQPSMRVQATYEHVGGEMRLSEIEVCIDKGHTTTDFQNVNAVIHALAYVPGCAPLHAVDGVG